MNNENVLIEYKRKGHRVPVGVVIAIGPNILGWSLCNKRDVFTKRMAVEMALNRAKFVTTLSNEEKQEYYQITLPQTLKKLGNKMIERSYKYYKPQS